MSSLYNIQEKIATSIRRASQWKDISKNRASTFNARVGEARARNMNLDLAYNSSNPLENQPEQGHKMYDSLFKSVQKQQKIEQL